MKSDHASASTKAVLMTKEDMDTLITTLFKESRDCDNTYLTFEHCLVRGQLRAFFKLMYNELPDDSFLKDHIPQELEKTLQNIRDTSLMCKLKSR
jgi:uncharacterized membrane-anchored protein YjiN (DUF445 family)